MKFKSIFIVIIVFILLSSCKKDFLEKINRNQPVEQTFWTTESNADEAIPTIYSPLRGQMYGYYGAYTGFQTMNRGDDVYFILGEEIFNWDYATFGETPATQNSDFGSLYTGISRANVFLYNIGNVKMDESKKEEMIGEVKFLRGLYYFLVVKNYGDAPLRLLPANVDPDGAMKSTSPASDLWTQVVSDFTDAENALPVSRPAAETGRATKGAAIAYLGKALIYQKKYQDAEAELGKLLQAPFTYDLVANYDDNFNENTEFNQESVFEINYDGKYGSGSWGSESATATMGFVVPNFVGMPSSGGWFKLLPSPSIIRDFIKEPRPAGSDTKYDKRMYTSFFWKYSDYETGLPDGKWFGDQTFNELWEGGLGKIQRGAPDYPVINGLPGRFLIKKFTNFYKNTSDANSMYDQSNQNNNLRLMRFDQVLLLHAEAAINNNDKTSAVNDLIRIRTRAGLGDLNWASMSNDDVMNEIRHQDELEFFLEGQRFFELTRWYDYNTLKQILVANGKQGADGFEPKHYFLPIPEDELNTNNKMVQNPLWK